MHRTLVLSALFVSAVSLADEELAELNKPAPMFRLPVYNAKIVGEPSLGLDRFVGVEAQDKKAKAILLSFMASYCAPCKKEMPYLQELSAKYKEQGLRVVMVSIDTELEGQKKVDELIAENKVTFPVLKDRFNIVARRWLGSKSPLPSLFMLNTNGVVTMVHRGYDQDASKLIAAEVEAALK